MPPRSSINLISEVLALIADRPNTDLHTIINVVRGVLQKRYDSTRTAHTARIKAEKALQAVRRQKRKGGR